MKHETHLPTTTAKQKKGLTIVFTVLYWHCQWHSNNIHYQMGQFMKAGVEVSIVTDSVTGKRGLRVFPYFEATDKQKAYIASVITIGLFVGSIILLSCAVPDPIIQPTVTIYPLP